MRIGIFGGSFNPPHKMHLKIAKDLLDKGYVDQVYFVPTGNKYKYKNNLVRDKYRLEMLKQLIKNDKRILVSDYEMKNHVVYTYETLAYFQEKYQNDEIYFICGMDNLSYIDEWKNGTEILKNYKLLVLDRKSHNKKEILEKFQDYRENIILVPLSLSSLSSTKVRNLLQTGNYQKLKTVVPKEVLEYIKEKNLYK